MARTFGGFSRRPLDDPYALAVGGRSASGGYARAEIPDANNPADIYKLMTGATSGQHTSPQFGTPSLPTHLPGGMSALEYNAANAERAQAATDAARGAANEQGGLTNVVQGIRTVRSSKAWDALAGALAGMGVDKLQTGARAGWEQPGFFDTQRTMGADAQGRQQLLEALLINQGRTQDAGFVRGMR